MKKFVFFAMMILLVSMLSACKVSPTEETLPKAAEIYPEWTYQWVSMRCVYDGGASEVVCQDFSTGDNTFLGTILNSMSQKGYELDEVVHTSDKGGMIQTFIFRKPFVVPTVEE